jgi:hypothetical protein
MNRQQRRAARRAMRPGSQVPVREANIAIIRAPGLPVEMKHLARVWLHFPETPARNILARANALSRRRAAAKRARQSRKVNR